MFKLPDLPYPYDALQPTISAETMRLHHDRHHARYVQAVNQLCQPDGLKPESLEALIASSRQPSRRKLFSNAAQAWNHAFFWSCMSPRKGSPGGDLADAIELAFGDLDGLKQAFVAEGEGHFGSGWVWLLAGPDGLRIQSTHDGDNLVGVDGAVPLIGCDLWEHAYYVDYRNERGEYLEAWFDALVDWEFAGHQLAAARGGDQPWRYPAPDGEPVRRSA